MSLKTTNQYLNGNFKGSGAGYYYRRKDGNHQCCRKLPDIYLVKTPHGNPYISVILRSKEKQILYTEMTELLNVIN